MNYAIIHDNQVTRIVNSSDSAAALKKMFAADDVRSVSESYTYIGDARAIDWDTQTVKPLSQQVDEGIVSVTKGSILDGEIIRDMTYMERINAGIDTVPDGWKIVGDHLETMTLAERYDAGQITAAQYNTSIRTERRVRYAMDADPLYMEYLYDLESGRDTAPVKKQAWLDKVAEIKTTLSLREE